MLKCLFWMVRIPLLTKIWLFWHIPKSASEKEQQKQGHRINGQLQNPKRQSDRASALRALPLAVLRHLLRKEKMGA